MGRDDRKPKFVYQTRTTEQVKKRATQSGGMFDSYIDPRFATFSPQGGDNIFRIFPPTWENAEHYGIDIYLHSNVGADGQTYICKMKTRDKRCLICEEVAQAIKDGDEKYADDLKPYKRVVAWILDRKKESDGPKVYVMPWTVDRDITAGCVDKRTNEMLLIDHPDDGYDVSFDKQGSRQNTKYVGVNIARRSTPISDDARLQQDWLEYVANNPLPEVLNYFDDEHITKVLTGRAPDRDEKEAKKEQAKNADHSTGNARSSSSSRSQPTVKEDDDPIPPKSSGRREIVNDKDAPLDDAPTTLSPLPARNRPKAEDEPAPVTAKSRAVVDEDDEPVVKPAPRPAPRVVDDDNDD